MCDSWIEPIRMNIINFLIYYNKRVIFYKLINTYDKIQNANYIKNLIDTIVEDEDIGELPLVMARAQSMTMFIYNHHWMHSMKQKITNGEILRSDISWLATNFIALKSIQVASGMVGFTVFKIK
ncbi:hypothetical protein BHE74_00003723 [Ensete ventricosum]|nr:hypothetical protein GW17_00023738 [Ensete ventricosum]RWW87447.1 hypothetical protein BHE74_00003723 [Ensete ventricosum]RZR90898.1 hypothetical protein BHM03_00018907 [Ensete ventricosum]